MSNTYSPPYSLELWCKTSCREFWRLSFSNGNILETSLNPTRRLKRNDFLINARLPGRPVLPLFNARRKAAHFVSLATAQEAQQSHFPCVNCTPKARSTSLAAAHTAQQSWDAIYKSHLSKPMPPSLITRLQIGPS
ncbi:hypothetical protein MJO28_007328 [Puccinia striiformis f. sp. tritici]|uniref:Uncharacterized protein n=1 Tax=Puccinia striiformis f. sp. tritici TaxID=168172 RepID=A0ACC0EFS6_9BASI|nr:hypothetical protein MJO28_007328 [Puccinia striiformis f. sp. tritici]